MSDSNRGGISKALADNWRPLCVIAVGLVFTVYLAWRLQPEKPDLPRYEPAKSQASSYQAGGRDCSPTALAAIRDIGKRTAKSDDCADKAEDYRLKADDLIQQTRAADGAQSQARSAYEQGWLALWATIGGLWTLIAAGLAAAYARDAAREGRRSADAAHKSYKAFVQFENATLHVDFFETPRLVQINGIWHIRFKIKVRNFGRTPALLDHVCMENGTSTNYWVIIASGGEQPFNTVFDLILNEDGCVVGYLDYATSIETAIKRTFIVSVENLGTNTPKFFIHPLAVLREGNEGYDDPFGKNPS